MTTKDTEILHKRHKVFTGGSSQGHAILLPVRAMQLVWVYIMSFVDFLHTCIVDFVIPSYPLWLKKHLPLSILLCLVVFAANAQGLLQKPVSIEVKKKRLSEVLTTISKQGNFYFSYNSNIIRKDSLVSVSAKNRSVKEVLGMLLGENCQYVETDKYIIIQPAEKEKWYTISGYITDGQTGDALPDVSVFERQQLVATITGKDGFFRLHLKDRDRFRTAEIMVRKGFYVDTSISLIKGYDQEVALSIVPETYSLPDMVITQNSGTGKSWLGRLFLSSRLKTQSLNLGKFFVDKPIQFSLIPGVGTHGKMSGQVANKFSFNLLGGYTAGSEGLELGGLFNIDKKDARYAQLAGLFNIVLGNTEGAQLSGISNYTQGSATGAQCAGFVNKAGKVKGVQAAGFVNLAFDTVDGVQMAGFVNGAKSANVQAAGYVNMAKNIDGAQVAGFVNVAGTVKGVQAAGFVNRSGNIDGVQVAGFINIAKKVRGVQIAGFVNIADSSDYPIGIINIIRKGDKAIGITTDEYGTYIATLRSGGRILYGIFGLAFNPYTVVNTYGLEAGLGAHLPITRHFRINGEISALSLSDIGERHFEDYGVRILPAVRLGPIEVFAGAGLDMVSFSERPEYAVINSNALWTDSRVGVNLEMRIGYRAGVQVHF